MNEEIKKGETTVLPDPFNVQFSYYGKSMKLTLKNGEDLFKIAEILSGILTLNGIENELEDVIN